MERDSESFHLWLRLNQLLYTLFSAGAGLSLSKEEPMMEGGATGLGEVGGAETTDAELIGVGVSWE